MSATTYKKRAIPQATRRAVAFQQGSLPGDNIPAYCESCGAEGRIWWGSKSWVTFPGLELDHRHPEALGGDSEPSNIGLLCTRCNRRKGAHASAA